jgi:thymidylate synthase
MYQRSGDIGLGVPFNIASYSLLTHIIAHQCDLIPTEFIYFLGNAHIYDDHIECLKTQILRAPNSFPTLEFINKPDTFDKYKVEDFKINNYEYHPTIAMTMRK